MCYLSYRRSYERAISIILHSPTFFLLFSSRYTLLFSGFYPILSYPIITIFYFGGFAAGCVRTELFLLLNAFSFFFIFFYCMARAGGMVWYGNLGVLEKIY
ncbi:hypothetical protein L873DRAFT_1295593 [Choiromyces venosus 120613-1]|uniref:Uncharacterized protein n=1 Tax=Choiromyces venosus 120613-1 TaxID=1336337 RepID=A0A3N4JEH4_9PEZI|nr:hypothetical protein L873DRAFT_1295593 [Choiromyces venosus 120613-1]